MSEKNRDPHREWLDLLDTDGPFLSVPVLKKAWPTGMNAPDRSALDALRDAKPAFEKAWDAWDLADKDTADRGAAALEKYRQARDAWVDVILRTVLGWKNFYLTPASVDVKVHSPDYAVTVSPTGALTRGDTTGALVLVTDPVESLRDPLNDGWAASPIDRMEELLRKSGVRIGVVTDGRWWAVVSARPETMVASGITDSQRWIELPAVRDAFLQLLRLPRLVGNRKEDLLTELFGDSVAAAEEITEALGTNVRRAVELLVQALSESALGVRRRGEPDPLPEDRDEVYQAAVTVMMRVVFLLFAEERGLLPQGELFTGGYGISDELDTLDQRARDEGAEALDSSHLTWHRLLATSQALYRGASFEDIRLPSYGGSLFDPARFAFLTARDSYDTLAVTVSDRVMLEVLRAAQIAELRGEPARRISFRDIDVEQIGYIYEGLLGYSARDVDEVVVGLIGKKGEEPEIPLSLLEEFAASRRSPDALANAILTWAKNDQPAAVPPTKSALARAIRDSGEVEDADRALRAAVPADPRPAGTAPPVPRRDPPRPARPPDGLPARRPGRGGNAVPGDGRRALHAQVPRHRSRTARPRTSRLRPGSPPAGRRLGAGGLRPDPGAQGRRHRVRLRRVPRRRGQVPRRPARRGLGPGRGRHRPDAGRTEDPRDPHGHRHVPVRRGHQRDGRRDVQAVAVAGVPRPEAPVLLRRRQDPPRQLAPRPDRRAAAEAPAHRPGRREHAAEPVRDRRGRRAPPGDPAAAATRQRGQQRRPAAVGQHEAPPVAPVPGGHGRAHGDRRRRGRHRAQARRQAGAGAERGVREPRHRPRRGLPEGPGRPSRGGPCWTRS